MTFSHVESPPPELPRGIAVLPWRPAGNREIADGANNVMQYTNDNIGFICLAVNAHAKMRLALMYASKWLAVDPEKRPDETEFAGIVQAALGTVGFETLARRVEELTGPDPEVDRAIAWELQRPATPVTASMDAALGLMPSGWSWSMKPDHDKQIVVTLTREDGRTVSATAGNHILALVAASVRAIATD